MPIGGTQPPLVVVNGYEYRLPPDGIVRLLGLHFTTYNLIGKQTEVQANKAQTTLNTMW